MENPMTSTRKMRRSNLELYRIITMYLIVLHHYVVNSGLTAANGVIYSNSLSWRSLFLLIAGAWGKTGINCFVLITGYFMCKSHITARKFVKLLGEIFFYNIIIYLIFLLSGYEPFSIKELILTIIPINLIEKNFSECYLVFFLFIPFLNILIQQMTKKQYHYLLLISGFAYIVLGTVHRITFNYVSWFIIIYLIGAYLRLYPLCNDTNTRFWVWLTFTSIALSALSVCLCTWAHEKLGWGESYIFVTDSNSFLPTITAISSFMLFKNLRIKQSRFINSVAASTFGVLCIHANSDTMRRWLWVDTLDNVGHYSSPWMPVHALGCAAIVFTICVLIDKVRITIFEKPFFKLWDKKGWTTQTRKNVT